MWCGKDCRFSDSEKRTSSSVSAGALAGQSLRFSHVSLCVDSNQALFVAAQPVPDHSSERIQLFPNGFHPYLVLDRYIFSYEGEHRGSEASCSFMQC